MKVFGIPIRTEASFFVMTLFLGMGRGFDAVLLAEWALIVFISILVHELGHGLAGRCLGLSPEIRLHSMGGATHFPGGKGVQPSRHIVISLAGPFSGFLFGGITLMLRSILDPHTLLLRTLFADLLWVNFGWGLFNLLPMLPLDGGNVMKSVEECITGSEKGRASHIISLLVAPGLCIWALMEKN
ncbi:MAG TPA: site-2 protease family protein, partial [Blastocatellia bacterium]